MTKLCQDRKWKNEAETCGLDLFFSSWVVFSSTTDIVWWNHVGRENIATSSGKFPRSLERMNELELWSRITISSSPRESWHCSQVIPLSFKCSRFHRERHFEWISFPSHLTSLWLMKRHCSCKCILVILSSETVLYINRMNHNRVSIHDRSELKEIQGWHRLISMKLAFIVYHLPHTLNKK